MLHENMPYALESLLWSSDIFSIIKTGNFMVSNFICEKPTAHVLMLFAINLQFIFCLINYYPNLNHLSFVEELDILWSPWQKHQTKLYNNIEKVNKEGTVSILLSHIKEMRAKFVIDSNVKSSQSTLFKFNIQLAIQKDSTKAVIQVDWAENYACFCQNKTNTAHFGQNQFFLNFFYMCHLAPSN